MSRYFFHILNGEALIDTVGVEFSNIDDVRHEAICAAGQILSAGDQTWSGEAWRMVVADEAGTIVFGVSFATDRHGL
jgi:hypothetical protein